MKIFFEQKKPGRIRQSVEPVPLVIALAEQTVGGLIAASVRSCVALYNDKVKQNADDFDKDTLRTVLSVGEISDLAAAGKVAFGFLAEGKLVTPESAVANALQSYEDGLFRIFLNGSPLGNSDEKIAINEGDTLTVVRLTMLAGRMW